MTAIATPKAPADGVANGMSVHRTIAVFLAFRLFRNLYFHVAVIVPYFYGRGLSLSDMFVLESAYYLAKVVSDIPTGMLADLFSRRACLVLSGLVATVGYLVMGIGSGFGAFLAAEILLGVAVSFSSGADTVALFDALKAAGKIHLFPRIEGVGGSLRNLAFGIAAAAGGFIAAFACADRTWLATAACTSIAAAIACFLPSEIAEKRASAIGPRKMLRTLAAVLQTDRFVVYVFLLFAAVFSLVRMGSWFLQLMIAALGYGTRWNGIVFACTMAVSILSGVFTAQLFPIARLNRSVLTISAMSLLFPVMWAIGLTDASNLSICALTAGAMMYSVLQGIYDATPKIWIASRVPSQIRTTLLSTATVAANLTFAAVGPFSGWLHDRYGLKAALVIITFVYLVPITVLILRLRQFSVASDRVTPPVRRCVD